MLKPIASLCGLLLVLLFLPCISGAQTVTLSIPAERDSTLMEPHPRDNNGAWGYLWLKWNSQRGFESRVLLGFDLTPLAGRAADVLAATVVLRAATHTFPVRGTGLSVFAMQPNAEIDWVEGSDRFNGFAYCSRRDLWRAPETLGGAGVSWLCEVGPVVDDVDGPRCLVPPSSTTWSGGLAQAPEPPDQGPRGIRTEPSDANKEVKGYDPLCRKALSCLAATGSVDCWRRVEFDLTADVREMLEIGQFHPSWLVKKDRVDAGGAYFFSREGAVCIMGRKELGPELVVTLVERTGDPPGVDDPPEHCETYR